MRSRLRVALGSGVALGLEHAKAGNSAKGKTLVDAKGMTLYAYDRDTTAGKSACNGNCATNWPPLMASADAKADGAWTVITRDDGGKQWAYQDKASLFLERRQEGRRCRRRRPQQHVAGHRRTLITRARRPGGRGCATGPLLSRGCQHDRQGPSIRRRAQGGWR